MYARLPRRVFGTLLVIGMGLSQPGCTSNQTTIAALIDWASTTTGSLAQIFVKAYLDSVNAAQNADPTLLVVTIAGAR